MISKQTAERALLASELRLADALTALSWCISGRLNFPELAGLVEQPRQRGEIDGAFYQKIHDELTAYQQNNWLVGEVEHILTPDLKTIVELGCGNGGFLKAIAKHVDCVTGIDWAKSPLLEPLPENTTFAQRDVLTEDVPAADLVCSADLLEHFAPEEIGSLLTRMNNAAARQYHVIACYDDGHSHLTVMPPGAWLATFRRVEPSFTIARVSIRRDDPNQIVCTIAKGQ